MPIALGIITAPKRPTAKIIPKTLPYISGLNLAKVTPTIVGKHGAKKKPAQAARALVQIAPLFPIEQIAIIDRNIIRLAVYEILHDSSVPTKAAVNEAVELSKYFGNDTSPKFVNGVLGSVITEKQKVRAGGE